MTTYLQPGLPSPRPARDGLDIPFWEGLAAHRLVVPRCSDCGARRFPPEWVCPRCRSFSFDWEEVSATGRVFSWTRVWHPTHPALAAACPYLAVVVELDADPAIRMVGNLLGDPLQEMTIGAPVEAEFEDGGEGKATLLQWRVAERPT